MISKIPVKLRLSLIFLIAFGLLIFIFTRPVIVQDLAYHEFVDKRGFWHIPNALDVLSNLGFLIVGFLGLSEVRRQKGLVTRRSWYWFFISVILVAPGSAYYHWLPTNSTLFWDRLPMSLGFMAVYVALLSEHISLKYESTLFYALAAGAISVLTWAITTDLRFYFWVQFSSFITIPMILLLFRSIFTRKSLYLGALGFYGLAKWAEIQDREVFAGTNELISGHSLKHVLAAIGLGFLWWMLKTRTTIDTQEKEYI